MARCRSLSHPYDPRLSRMLMVYVATGIAFMILPGTFVGVLSLLKIATAHAPGGADQGWVQAHGHAQIFGWLGTFILGIGYYTIPRLRLAVFSPRAAWITYALWTAGVTIRWAVGSWPWQWRILFPLAGILELAAVVLFAVSVYLSRPRIEDDSWRRSVVMITAAGVAMVLALAVNAGASIFVAMNGSAPVFDAELNRRFLVLSTWGFIVPFIWGFSSRWLPPLLGLRPTRKRLMTPSLAVFGGGIALAMAGYATAAAVAMLAASIFYVAAMRYLEPSAKEAKLNGVHPSTPGYIRVAYVWLLVAAVLAIVTSLLPQPNGYMGASRHALTVGFFTGIVFTVGPRILPGLLHVRELWSPGLMAATLMLINVGCAVRVVSQIGAYEQLWQQGWSGLALSAIIEMVGVTLFAVNMVMTLTAGRGVSALAAAPTTEQV